MNGDILCNGQPMICSFLSPSKPRSPLHDNSIPLVNEDKLAAKRTVQSETQKHGEAPCFYCWKMNYSDKRLGSFRHLAEQIFTVKTFLVWGNIFSLFPRPCHKWPFHFLPIVRLNNVNSEASIPEVEENKDRKCFPCRTEDRAKEPRGEAACLRPVPEPTPNSIHSPNQGKGARCKIKTKKTTPRGAESKHFQNRKVTDYYPIRRSSRKSKTELKCEEQKHIDHLIKNGIEEGMQVKHIEGKGRGVFAERTFHKGQFVVEYHGDLLQITDAKKREAAYAQDPATGCYMYYFQYHSKTYCVDATKETNRLGRLINHSKNGNCQTKIHNINGIPHLILVASRDIEKDEELLYDYGDRSKASIAAHPWLKQ